MSDTTTTEGRVQYVLDMFFGGHQPSMANAALTYPYSVSRWVAGKTTPSRRVLLRLDKSLGVPVADWILTGAGPTPGKVSVPPPPPEWVYCPTCGRKMDDMEAKEIG